MTAPTGRPRPRPARPPPSEPPPRGPAGVLRNTWRGLTSMRTALVLLFLLAVAALPGRAAAAALAEPGARRPVLRRQPDARAGAGPARLLRRLRRAVVRRGLPAADGLAGGLRAAARRGARPRAAGRAGRDAAQPRPAAAPRAPTVDETPEAVAGARSRAGCAAGADGARGARRRPHLLRREGLPARGRQPGVPPEPDRAAGRRSPPASCSATRARSSCSSGGGQFCNTGILGYDSFRAGLRVDGTDLEPFCVRVDDFTATYLPNGQPSSVHRARSATRPPRTWTPAHRRLAARTRWRSTTRCASTATASTCWATATPRGSP